MENGASMWHSAQPMNDVAGLLDKFPGIAIEGGWDTQARCSTIEGTEEEVIAETIRCMNEYKKPGYIFTPCIITKEYGNAGVTGRDPRLPIIMAKYEELKWF